MSAKTWFEVDKEGLAKLLERKGKEFVLYELIQNTWDTDAKVVTVTLQPSKDIKGYADIEVIDDHPDGWKNLTHAWTLYAESEKKGNAEKRGRFNLGEKLVLALCKVARIETTSGGVMFDVDGRHTLKTKREAGSRFWATLRMNQEEREAAAASVMKLLPPQGIKTYFNGELIGNRTPIRKVEATLPTEVADQEGVLRRSSRKTLVEIYEALPGEVPSVYEMGIPVVETGDKYHYNVLQKVPLNSDRDNVTPAYLRELRTVALNATWTEVKGDEAAAAWVRDAAEDEDVSKEAIEHVVTERFGEKRVIFDPSDQEGTKMAVSQGYTVIPPRALSGAEWANVRKYEAALPAGVVTPSPKPYSPDGKEQNVIPEEKWTAGIKKVADYSKDLGYVLLGKTIRVKIVSDVTWPYGATFGPSGDLTFNVGRLGHEWFNRSGFVHVDELLLHEFSHDKVSDHMSSAFYDEICRLGAKMVQLAVSEANVFKKHGR